MKQIYKLNCDRFCLTMSNNLPRLSNVLRSSLMLEINRNLNNNGAEYLAYQLWKENEQTKYVNLFVIRGPASLTEKLLSFLFSASSV